MTAILKEMRQLEERLARGEITDAAYLARRAALIESVDVVETEFVDAGGTTTTQPARKSGSMILGLGITICLVVVGICLAVAMVTFADFNLALTLGVTVLAALSVALFRSLEE